MISSSPSIEATIIVARIPERRINLTIISMFNCMFNAACLVFVLYDFVKVSLQSAIFHVIYKEYDHNLV